MVQVKIRKFCDHCGSENVYADALAQWDFEGQRWELSSTFDSSYCKDCDEETGIVDKVEAEGV